MPKKLNNEKIEDILNLYSEGFNLREIASKTGVCQATAWGYIRLKNRINPETGENFGSITEFYNYQARQRTNPETGENFRNLSDYQRYTYKERINPETGEIFGSRGEIALYRKIERKKILKGKELKNIIKSGLEKLSRNQSWLAKQVGITRQSISQYVKGNTYPKINLLLEILEVFEEEQNLENLVLDYQI